MARRFSRKLRRAARLEREIRLFLDAEAHLQAGRRSTALRAFRHVLRIRPTHIAARRGAAAALEALGHRRRANAERKMATVSESQSLLGMGDYATEHGLHGIAATCYRRAIALDPKSGPAIWGLAESLRRNQLRGQALRWYKRYQALHPGEPESAHMIAALGGRRMPKRAGDAYVKSVFDWFADDFDRKLVEDLDYKAPDVLFAAVSRIIGRKRAALDILDLGCGTGLAGVQFRKLARWLEGVDLSPKMLRHARKRRVYDLLRVGEMVAALDRTPERFEVIVAADVFCYVGDLAPVVTAAAGALRPGGHFAFTVERRNANGFGITSSGRYAHHPAYVRACGRKAGLVEVLGRTPVVRYEYGEPVHAHLSVMRKR